MSLAIYLFIALSSIAYIIWKNPLSVIIAISAAPIGIVFTIICLVTGSLWGKPIWGTWWVWDARLTSMLILLFFYIGYLSLYNAYDDKYKGGQMSSLLAILGVVNVPIVKFSVDWWNTLHQPASIIRSGGVSIDKSMLIPLVLMFFAYLGYFVITLTLNIKTELMLRKSS
jgi:heme exporter protein C